MSHQPLVLWPERKLLYSLLSVRNSSRITDQPVPSITIIMTPQKLSVDYSISTIKIQEMLLTFGQAFRRPEG
jgi:hypothetical protein